MEILNYIFDESEKFYFIDDNRKICIDNSRKMIALLLKFTVENNFKYEKPNDEKRKFVNLFVSIYKKVYNITTDKILFVFNRFYLFYINNDEGFITGDSQHEEQSVAHYPTLRVLIFIDHIYGNAPDFIVMSAKQSNVGEMITLSFCPENCEIFPIN